MRALVVAAAALLVASAALAFRGAAPLPSPPDPFVLTELSAAVAGYQDTNNKTLVPSTIDALTSVVIIIAGEGNSGTMTTDKFAAVHAAHIHNVNVYDGADYIGADPLLGPSAMCAGVPPGCGTGGWALQLADAILDDGHVTDVYLVPLSIYGSKVSDWETGALANRIGVGILRIQSRTTIPENIFLIWGQGESDHGTAQADYEASLLAVVANARAALATVSPNSMAVFVAKQTWNNGVTDADVQAAQIAVPDNNEHGRNIWSGPNADAIGASFRQTGNTYWTGNSGTDGAQQYVNAWMTALRVFGGPF